MEETQNGNCKITFEINEFIGADEKVIGKVIKELRLSGYKVEKNMKSLHISWY